MKIFKILFTNIISPYRYLPWKELGSVLYTAFALWCFNLAVLISFLIVLPLLMKYPENILGAWGRCIEIWFTSPGQLYYLWFCFIFSVILNFSEWNK